MGDPHSNPWFPLLQTSQYTTFEESKSLIFPLKQAVWVQTRQKITHHPSTQSQYWFSSSPCTFLAGSESHSLAWLSQNLSSPSTSMPQNWQRSQLSPSFFLHISFPMCSLISLSSKASPQRLHWLQCSSHSFSRWGVNSLMQMMELQCSQVISTLHSCRKWSRSSQKLSSQYSQIRACSITRMPSQEGVMLLGSTDSQKMDYLLQERSMFMFSFSRRLFFECSSLLLVRGFSSRTQMGLSVSCDRDCLLGCSIGPQNSCCSLECSRLGLEWSIALSLEWSSLEWSSLEWSSLECSRLEWLSRLRKCWRRCCLLEAMSWVALSQPRIAARWVSSSLASFLTFWLGSSMNTSAQFSISLAFCSNCGYLMVMTSMRLSLVVISLGSFLTLLLWRISSRMGTEMFRKLILGSCRQVVQASSLVFWLVSFSRFSSSLMMSSMKKGRCCRLNFMLRSAILLRHSRTVLVTAACLATMMRAVSSSAPMYCSLVSISEMCSLRYSAASFFPFQFLCSAYCQTLSGMKVKQFSTLALSLLSRGGSSFSQYLTDSFPPDYCGCFSDSPRRSFRSRLMEVLSTSWLPSGIIDWFRSRGLSLLFSLVSRGRSNGCLPLLRRAGTTWSSCKFDKFLNLEGNYGDLKSLGSSLRLVSSLRLASQGCGCSAMREWAWTEQNCSSFLKRSSFWNSTISFFLLISSLILWHLSQSSLARASCFSISSRSISFSRVLKLVITVLRCAALWQSSRSTAISFSTSNLPQISLNTGRGSLIGLFACSSTLLRLWAISSDSLTSSSSSSLLASVRSTPCTSWAESISPWTVSSLSATWLKMFMSFLWFSCRTRRMWVQENSKQRVFSSCSSKEDCELSLGLTNPNLRQRQWLPSFTNTSTRRGILYW